MASPSLNSSLSHGDVLDASPSKRQPVQRTPSLLPAFEPLSSSPFPRAGSKRKFLEEDEDTSPLRQKDALKFYPTPVPTSSTGMLPSSPTRSVRPTLERTFSERNPLCAVPSIELKATGEPIRMGRSSNSSDYQLSNNRLISRVHLQATYHAPNAFHPDGEVEIECLGWNGATVHYAGRVVTLSKGQCFKTDKPSLEIMLDVQDARVVIAWPHCEDRARVTRSTSTEEWNNSPRHTVQDHFASSPPPMLPQSPVSPSPVSHLPDVEATFVETEEPVRVFEDPEASDPVLDHGSRTSSVQPNSALDSPSVQEEPHSSLLSSLTSEEFDDLENEENDPIIHSFGPFGDNLLSRVASISASRNVEHHSVKPSISSPTKKGVVEDLPRHPNESPIKNHVINQLAFSRAHSMPLSTILGNLPPSMKNSEVDGKKFNLRNKDLHRILDDIPCIGEIHREGKDAAGKPLEDEYYYMPEKDEDVPRREAVMGGIGGTGLRAVRKAHKQYYWKKPRH